MSEKQASEASEWIPANKQTVINNRRVELHSAWGLRISGHWSGVHNCWHWDDDSYRPLRSVTHFKELSPQPNIDIIPVYRDG